MGHFVAPAIRAVRGQNLIKLGTWHVDVESSAEINAKRFGWNERQVRYTNITELVVSE